MRFSKEIQHALEVIAEGYLALLAIFSYIFSSKGSKG